MVLGPETEIALVKQDINNILELFKKLDSAIDRFGEISNDINKLLAVHEERINNNEKKSDVLERAMDILKRDVELQVKELHSKVNTVTREIAIDIAETEKRITNVISSSMTDLKKDLQNSSEEQRKLDKSMDERVGALERWRWIVMGGAATIGFLLAKTAPFFEFAFK